MTGAGPRPSAHTAAVWYAGVAAVGFAASVLLVSAMVARGKPADRALSLTVHGDALSYGSPAGYDSSLPLLKAYRRALVGESPYRVFFEGQGKFQYPPPALLPAALLPAHVVDEALAGWEGSTLQAWNSWLCRLSVAATLLLSAGTALAAARRAGPATPGARAALAAAVVAAGVGFYPFVIGYQLGQIQLFLNALMAGALLAFVTGHRFTAGVLFGLCCLVKPQFGLVAVWALLRREFRLAAGLLLAVVPVALWAGAVFGFSEYGSYLGVLRELARRGEVLWYNQSVHGLLHRWVDPGAALYWDAIGSPLPPYRPAIHLAGTVASMCLLGAALVLGRSRDSEGDGRILDLCALTVAATLASPVAWNHHYGVFFPVFALAIPLLAGRSQGPNLLLWLAAGAFLGIAFELEVPEFLFRSGVTGILASHMFFAGVLWLGVLLAAARRQWGEEPLR